MTRTTPAMREERALVTRLLWLGATFAVWGIGYESAWMVNLATLTLGTAYVGTNMLNGTRGALSCLTVHVLMCSVAAAGNVVGLLSGAGPQRARYFLFASEPHLYLAALLHLAGTFVPAAGFALVWNRPAVRSWSSVLVPPVVGLVRDSRLIPLCLGASAASILTQIALRGAFLFTDTLASLLSMLPCLCVFVLARASAQRRARGAFAAALAIAFAESARAFLFTYLRSSIAMPYFAFALGAWLGRGTLRVLWSPRFYPIYAGAVLYGLNYGVLGAIREFAPQGVAKIAYMSEFREHQSAEEIAVEETLLSRVSNFNQLSQIGRIIEEDGFYHGSTISYLTFAFVPRFLWPDKPKIQRGSWFAVRIGQGRLNGGWFTNTINMTQAGELYLNWGWSGVIGGLLAFGAFYGVLWVATGLADRQNALGAAFAYYLCWSLLGQNGDLTLMVSTTAYYLLFVAATAALHLTTGMPWLTPPLLAKRYDYGYGYRFGYGYRYGSGYRRAHSYGYGAGERRVAWLPSGPRPTTVAEEVRAGGPSP